MKITLAELRQIINEEINEAYDETKAKGKKDDLSSTHKDGEGEEEDPELDYAKNEELEEDDDSFPVSATGLGGPVGKRRF